MSRFDNGVTKISKISLPKYQYTNSVALPKYENTKSESDTKAKRFYKRSASKNLKKVKTMIKNAKNRFVLLF